MNPAICTSSSHPYPCTSAHSACAEGSSASPDAVRLFGKPHPNEVRPGGWREVPHTKSTGNASTACNTAGLILVGISWFADALVVLSLTEGSGQTHIHPPHTPLHHHHRKRTSFFTFFLNSLSPFPHRPQIILVFSRTSFFRRLALMILGCVFGVEDATEHLRIICTTPVETCCLDVWYT